MKLSDAARVILTGWEHNPTMTFYLESEPGAGKTDLAKQLAKKMGYRSLLIRPSDRDSSDILGIPDLAAMAEERVVKWVPPQELWSLDESQEDGKILLIIDELSDCNVAVQNVLCGLINDRHTANVTLHPDVRVIATGNRVQDKSGANRIVSKLGNRVTRLPITVDFQDWKVWAMNNDITPELIGFLTLRTELLSKFDPQNFSNPTPRSWEKLDRTLPWGCVDMHVWMDAAGGTVGEEAAGEYTNFLKLLPEMPDINQIIADPMSTKIPTDPSLIYALCAGFVRRLDYHSIGNIFAYMGRPEFPKDFRAMCINDIRTTETLKEFHEHAAITKVELDQAKYDLQA